MTTRNIIDNFFKEHPPHFKPKLSLDLKEEVEIV
jgi:hypothetical protein